jgi:phosphinothricin acetyltransferase
MNSNAIRSADGDDAAAIAAIYNHYVRHDIATFEIDAVDAAEMRARIAAVRAHGLPWLVLEECAVGEHAAGEHAVGEHAVGEHAVGEHAAEQPSAVRGYAYATPWRTRAAYRHSVESSIYLAPDVGGRGLGRRLYQALLAALRPLEVHAVIGGVSLPNPASIALHERMGFRKVAHFSEVGRKFDRWIDVGYWQLMLPQDRG